jgi:hypothetical protein
LRTLRRLFRHCKLEQRVQFNGFEIPSQTLKLQDRTTAIKLSLKVLIGKINNICFFHSFFHIHRHSTASKTIIPTKINQILQSPNLNPRVRLNLERSPTASPHSRSNLAELNSFFLRICSFSALPHSPFIKQVTLFLFQSSLSAQLLRTFPPRSQICLVPSRDLR